MAGKKSLNEKKEVRLVLMISIIIGISLIAQMGMRIAGFVGHKVLPGIVGRIVLTLLFWAAFILLFMSIYYFVKLSSYFKTKRREQALISLGLVIGVAQVGNLGMKAADHIGETLLPDVIVKLLLYLILLTGVFFVIFAIYTARKI